MKKVTIEKLNKEDVERLAYDFIDDSLDPHAIKKHFKKDGIELKKYYVRRENGVLMLGFGENLEAGEHKFKISIEPQLVISPKAKNLRDGAYVVTRQFDEDVPVGAVGMWYKNMDGGGRFITTKDQLVENHLVPSGALPYYDMNANEALKYLKKSRMGKDGIKKMKKKINDEYNS